ncbi:TetR/AcrR family transcriptional regulator [Mycolicibacterium lacusdiani]|uniref:TetR/AcrR family transcriptional regulator n=1 Tax=Mycolicibacterium lacusdiani TaxID=2895283 RepID=UPI001F210662|nr:TetR/AcrR family transcriptional regulator [Mycolicibacterium lacusdiani]
MARTGYHHGDLRAALIAAGREMVAEHGIAALSVADAAKRTGVSAAAPYRHFPNRRAFLAAVATAAAREFDDQVRAAIPPRPDGDPGEWAIEAMAATAGAYVRFVARTRIGWDVIYGTDVGDAGDEERLDVARSLNDAFLAPALAVTGGDVRRALRLLEHEVAAAHGYASLFVAGLFDRRYPEIDRAATQAAAITRTLALAARADAATT